MKKPNDVDAYIASAPREVRPKLAELRRIIRIAAPKADERISYGMPYYHYRGRLAYFQLAKAHIGLYLPTPVIELHRKELGALAVSKATVHLALDKKLPALLIRKLIKARMKMNEAKAAGH